MSSKMNHQWNQQVKQIEFFFFEIKNWELNELIDQCIKADLTQGLT